MDKQKEKNGQAHWAIARLIFDKVQSHPNVIQKSWSRDESNDVFYSFRIEHLTVFQPDRWFGLSVLNIECVVMSAGVVDIAVTLSPHDSLPFSTRLESSLSTIAAIGRKELPGDCELIMTSDSFSFDAIVVLRTELSDPTLLDHIRSFVAAFGVVIDK